jgi:hypothetical protein
MKPVLTILIALLLMLSSVSVAHAVVCARGVYQAGCAGPNRAVVTQRPAPRRVVAAPRRPVVVTRAPAIADGDMGFEFAVSKTIINGH